MENEKYIMNIKTVQSSAFRVLIEALKEILTDTNLTFDKDGIKLIATDNSKIVFFGIITPGISIDSLLFKELNFASL